MHISRSTYHFDRCYSRSLPAARRRTFDRFCSTTGMLHKEESTRSGQYHNSEAPSTIEEVREYFADLELIVKTERDSVFQVYVHDVT